VYIHNLPWACILTSLSRELVPGVELNNGEEHSWTNVKEIKNNMKHYRVSEPGLRALSGGTLKKAIQKE
jgi:hypothetical protein